MDRIIDYPIASGCPKNIHIQATLSGHRRLDFILLNILKEDMNLRERERVGGRK